MNLLQEFVLLEYQRKKTEDILGKKLEIAGAEDGKHSLAKVLDTLEKMDPTKNQQYVEWLCRQYIQKKFRLEDSSRVNEVLVRFEKIKNKLEQRDINRYDFHKLQDLMGEHFDKVEIPDDVDVKSVDGAKILYNGPLGSLAIPTTKKAACALGSGTKWCTAATKDNMFAHYSGQGPLYIWRDKSGDKFQFHFETMQFMNDKDAQITQEQFNEFHDKNPVLKKLFAKKEDEAIANKKIDSYKIIQYWKSFIKTPWKKLEAAILATKNYKLAFDYMSALGKDTRWKDGEDLLLQSSEYTYKYAVSILKKPWPEGEEAIFSKKPIDRHYALLWRQSFPKATFKTAFAKECFELPKNWKMIAGI